MLSDWLLAVVSAAGAGSCETSLVSDPILCMKLYGYHAHRSRPGPDTAPHKYCSSSKVLSMSASNNVAECNLAHIKVRVHSSQGSLRNGRLNIQV